MSVYEPNPGDKPVVAGPQGGNMEAACHANACDGWPVVSGGAAVKVAVEGVALEVGGVAASGARAAAAVVVVVAVAGAAAVVVAVGGACCDPGCAAGGGAASAAGAARGRVALAAAAEADAFGPGAALVLLALAGLEGGSSISTSLLSLASTCTV